MLPYATPMDIQTTLNELSESKGSYEGTVVEGIEEELNIFNLKRTFKKLILYQCFS